MYYTEQFITEHMRNDVTDISLDSGDSAWNPYAPNPLPGPCDLKYIKNAYEEIDVYKARK